MKKSLDVPTYGETRLASQALTKPLTMWYVLACRGYLEYL